MRLFKVEVENRRELMAQVVLFGLFVSCACALMIFSASSAEAQARYASTKRSNAGIAHYARARAMCVETLEEFEVGRKHARPDLLLDAEEWRLTMISLCEQLNRLVDPKIRISNDGIQVNANPRLIARAKDKLPEVADGPKIRSDYGELARLQEKQDKRARMYSPQETQPVIEQPEAPVVEQLPEEPQLSDEELIEQAIQEAIDAEKREANVAVTDEDSTETSQEQVAEAQDSENSQEQLAAEEVSESEQGSEETVPASLTPQTEVNEIPNNEDDLGAEPKVADDSEDAKIATAIEQAIQNKLREIEGAGAEQEVVPESAQEDYDDEDE